MNLCEHNEKWKKFLLSERCPPILGLVPLSKGDCEEITALVKESFDSAPESKRYRKILELLKEYPSVMVVWLARKACESYDAGAFYNAFEEATGVRIPLLQRSEFVRCFLIACALSTRDVPSVIEHGSRKYVDKILFQAGLPLCHCKTFAAMLRSVEKIAGLPDPQDPEAAEELREHLLLRPELTPRPTLKRALQSPAGRPICLLALQVVTEQSFAGINPELGDELAEQFRSIPPGQIRRSARQPFIRIAQDCCSLDLVGPRQDANLAGNSGLTWIVNGTKYLTPSSGEFVYNLTNPLRVTVELRGLLRVQPPPRTFVLDLRERQEPFMLFDYCTGKLCRENTSEERTWRVQAGMYWLLHAAGSSCEPCDQQIEWPDERPDTRRTLSLIHIHPSRDVQLRTSESAVFHFQAEASPFFECGGSTLLADGGERMHYQWSEIPVVWLPNEGASTGDWSIRAIVADQDHSWLLERDAATAEQGGMFGCQRVGAELLASLQPGLHEVEISVQRRSHVKLRERFLLWSGLDEFRPGDRFVVSQIPQNLVREQCDGFSISANALAHRRDGLPEHTLAFSLMSGIELFQWHQSGVFLFSAEKRPGQEVRWSQHKLGDTFSASVDSCRWLRIRHEPPSEMEIHVNGDLFHAFGKGFIQPFVDISLATLATHFSDGGTIVLRGGKGNPERQIASFTQPLVPSRVTTHDMESTLVITVQFHDVVQSARPHIADLLTGKAAQLVETEAREHGRQSFASTDLPDVLIRRGIFDGQTLLEDANGNSVSLFIPKSGWPEGLWIVELECRRNQSSDWQSLVDKGAKRQPVLIASPPVTMPCVPVANFRSILLWRAYLSPSAFAVEEGEITGREMEVFDLLGELQTLLRQWPGEQMHWLEVLYRELCRHGGRVLRSEDVLASHKLLNLACQEVYLTPNQSLFVSVPGLLALPAERYNEIPTTQPLLKSLHWCAQLQQQGSVIGFFRILTQQNPEWMTTLGLHFRNFQSLAQGRPEDSQGEELMGFDIERFLEKTIGPLQYHSSNEMQRQFECNEQQALSRQHVEWALTEFAKRRLAAGDDQDWGAVNTLLNAAGDFRDQLQEDLRRYPGLLSNSDWENPWLSVTVDDDDSLLENIVRFASIFALAARAAAAGWLSLDQTIGWLRIHAHGQDVSERTIGSLVGMAPELFGYYLLFWELIIRTYPHDRPEPNPARRRA